MVLGIIDTETQGSILFLIFVVVYLFKSVNIFTTIKASQLSGFESRSADLPTTWAISPASQTVPLCGPDPNQNPLIWLLVHTPVMKTGASAQHKYLTDAGDKNRFNIHNWFKMLARVTPRGRRGCFLMSILAVMIPQEEERMLFFSSLLAVWIIISSDGVNVRPG